MSHQVFRQLLLELDPAIAAKHSTINHHVQGMDYLCLHRSDTLPIKLYFIDPARITARPGDILVARHTHRYAFKSTVLAGKLIHELYDEVPGATYECSTYAPETRTRTPRDRCSLRSISKIAHGVDTSYWVDTKDIHTLIVPDEPVLLGLMQFRDTAKTSQVYLPRGHNMDYPESFRPSEDGAHIMREKALQMMNRTSTR